MKINRCILLTVILILPCFGETGLCNGVSYNKDIYRCEYGELIGKCKGKDYYIAYDKCVNGVVVSGTASNNNSGTSTGNRGTFTDSRDGKTYKWVKIGKQTWMAENLNYNAYGSKCCDNKPANCQKYGRLYNWTTAMQACPYDWHLPSNAEWEELMMSVGGYRKAASKYLKATSGWNNYGNGEDKFGFAALPGGNGLSRGDFNTVGDFGTWWSSSESDADDAYSWLIKYDDSDVRGIGFFDKNDLLFSVRCLKN